LIRAPNAPQDKIKVMVTQQQPQENPLMEEWSYQRCTFICFFQFNICGCISFLHKAQVTGWLVIINLSRMLWFLNKIELDFLCNVS
jgi:hypothetical protein